LCLIHFAYSVCNLVRQRSKYRSTRPVKLDWRNLLTFPFFNIFSNIYTHWRSLHCHLTLTHYSWQPDRCRGCSCLCRSARTNFTAILQFYKNVKLQKEFLECEQSRCDICVRIVTFLQCFYTKNREKKNKKYKYLYILCKKYNNKYKNIISFIHRQEQNDY